MEDLLEELLSVLAPPSGAGTGHRKVASTKQLALGNGAVARKTQVNGSLASQKIAPETARKATEKMSQKTAQQSNYRSNHRSDQDTNGSAVNHGSPTLMTVASLSNLAIDQLLKTAQSLEPSADNSRDVVIESLLFDAGVAVPEALGHQVFSTQDGQVRKASAETDRQDALQDSIETANEPTLTAAVENDEGAIEGDLPLLEVPLKDEPLEDEPLEDQFLEDTVSPEPIAGMETHLEEPDIELYPGLEDSAAEIDESVMSAFDIGDFEGDFERDSGADTHATEGTESNGLIADNSGSGDFDPDDLEIDRLSLEALGFGAQADTEERNEADFYTAAERPETADVSLDELVSATEQNFLARWFKRLVGAKTAEPEETTAEISEPRLFESDYSPRETQSKSATTHDADYGADFDTEEALDRSVESPLELSVDEAGANALLALALDEKTVDKTSESFETHEARPGTDEGEELSESFEMAESANLPEASSGQALTNHSIRGDGAGEATDVIEAGMEAVVEPSDDLFVTADDIAERSPDEPLDESLDPLSTAARFEPTAFELDTFEPDTFELNTFEPDAADSSEEDGFAEDSLLEPLGEKAWLSEADNANEALHVAAAAGDLSGVWVALEANANVNALGLTQRTALSTAIEAGHVPMVEMLLEMCADPNLADVMNGSPVRYPLMVAATKAAEPVRGELLRLLLARGAKVNQANVMGQTALMDAAEQGYVDVMRLLIESNADLDAQDLMGQTAMLRAKAQGHEGAIALLQASSIDRERAIAFLKAVTQGDLSAVEQWLAAGISANTRVARMSALTQAAAKGEVAIARLLIEAGADIDYRFYETDPTPLFHAAYRGQLEMVALLLEAGARPRLSPDYPIEALDYAEIGQQKSDDAAAFEPLIALLATLATRPS